MYFWKVAICFNECQIYAYYFINTVYEKCLREKVNINYLGYTHDNKSPLPLRMKLYIYKTYMRPILTYACPAMVSYQTQNSLKYVSKHTIRKSTNIIPSISDYINSATHKLKYSNPCLSNTFPTYPNIPAPLTVSENTDL